MGNELATAAEVMYGNPGGDAADLSAIDSTLESSGFGSITYQARSDGKHDFAKEIDRSRSAIAGAMHEMGFSQSSAQQIGGIVKEYWDNPRSKESAAKGFDAALGSLEKRWGDKFESNMAGAVELLGVLRRKDPSFGNFLASTGMQGDETLLRILGETARHRKATKK